MRNASSQLSVGKKEWQGKKKKKTQILEVWNTSNKISGEHIRHFPHKMSN